MFFETTQDNEMMGSSALAPIIGALGQARFSDQLLTVLQPLLGVDLFTAFTLADNGQPSFEVGHASKFLGGVFADQAAKKYMSAYWHQDPALNEINKLPLNLAKSLVCQQASSDIPQSAYRAFCYDRPQLVDRVSVFSKVGGKRFVFSVYRHATRGPFSSTEVGMIRGHSLLLSQVLEKHLMLFNPKNLPPIATSTQHIEQRLKSIQPALSMRERQVCARLVLGMATKEIACECELEPSSIITYKKRAFDKFGVTDRRSFIKLWNAHVADLSA